MKWYSSLTLQLVFFALVIAAGANAELNPPSSSILKLFGKSIKVNDNANINASEEFTLGRKRATPSLAHASSNQDASPSDMGPHHDLFTESLQCGKRIRSTIDFPLIPDEGIHETGGGISEREETNSPHAGNIDFHSISPPFTRRK
ncbi:hypothetical protein PCASD_02142 [Puccinia coronata f. sp. avenae]|nr:hypothetical protein PCASD_02142 [Puccinia coronata f. sp. avenae]